MIIQQIQSWFTQAQAQTLNLVDKGSALPEAVAIHLLRQIDLLPAHPAHLEAVHTALDEAMLRLKQTEKAPNHLVVLASPTEDIPCVLRHALNQWREQHLWQVNVVEQLTSTAEPAAMLDGLKQEITSRIQASKYARMLIVIPRLENCFLRCIHGLEGVEWLRDTILANRSHFWLVGCNHWAWEYLDRVCQLKAYFDAVIQLPTLSGEQLQSWFSPVTTGVLLDWSTADADEQADRSQQYFKALADTALGLSRVAAGLWVNSLRYPPDREDNAAPLPSLTKTELRVARARCPDLPKLQAAERFLLFSLLLHGKMTLPRLALSLGETQGLIQAQARTLRQAGIIREQQQQFSVRPAHYPQLRLDLANSNFLIPQEP